MLLLEALENERPCFITIFEWELVNSDIVAADNRAKRMFPIILAAAFKYKDRTVSSKLLQALVLHIEQF